MAASGGWHNADDDALKMAMPIGMADTDNGGMQLMLMVMIDACDVCARSVVATTRDVLLKHLIQLSVYDVLMSVSDV
jgi:hypothetical protein